MISVTGWENKEIVEMLRALGLPADSSLSVLCVEMMPTLSALVYKDPGEACVVVTESLEAIGSGCRSARLRAESRE